MGQCCCISYEPHCIVHLEGPMKRVSFPGAAGLRGSPRAASVPFAQRKGRVGSKDHGGGEIRRTENTLKRTRQTSVMYQRLYILFTFDSGQDIY